MANAADNYQFDASNVFDNWDLNPLAQQVGAGADGVRDTLSAKRDAFLQPYMQDYRNAATKAGASADSSDQAMFGSQGFQNFVKTGQTNFAPQQPQTTVQQWNQSSGPQGPPPGTPQLAPAAPDPRRDALFETLMKRSNPDAITSADPNVAAQSNAYSAQEERARRDYLDQVAERSGPYVNMQGEERMAAERKGQRTGAFEANLIAQEIKAQRDQIAQALESQAGMLSEDKKQAYEERLANLDALLKSKGFDLQDKSINSDMEKALLNNDVQMRQLGLNEWDRASYYDALKSGYLG